jgi:hypothetical protein
MPVEKASAISQDSRMQSLKSQTLEDWKCYCLPQEQENAPGCGDARVELGPGDLDTFSKLINYGVAQGHDYVLPLAPGIELTPEALQEFSSYLDSNPNAAAVYSSYKEENAEGKVEDVQLYPHEGCPHERFDFGFVKIYRSSAVKEVGGARVDLQHAGEYDLDLKLGDKYSLELIDKPLYTARHVGGGSDDKPSALHSPGKGKLGGFSYIFYPADLEQEVTSVLEDMLRRRGAWIDHETVNVPYPAEPYEVLATVIIPVLNRAKYIGNALERVIEGSFQDFEVVVIDNGSTDGTQQVVEEYAKRDPRIRLIHGKGGSIASALNEGIKAAKGKYICQLDSDDEYTPDTLEMMVDHMESHPKCGLAISYYELMDENRGHVEGIDPVTHLGYTRNQILRRDGGGALRVFPKVVLEENGYYDEENFGNFGEDYDMVLKTGEKYDVDRVHKVLYRYRRHSDNTDVTRDPLMKIQNKNNARLNALERRKKINRELGKN